MVKKLIIFMLVLAMCVSICACGETPEADNDPKETTAETTDPPTDPSDTTDPTDSANPGNPSDPDDPTNPGSSANPTSFQNPEEAAISFLTAFHRNDAETLMKQTSAFENDAILQYFDIEVPAGADKNALLLNAWKSLVWGEYAPDRQIDVTTTVYAEDDAKEIITEVKNQFLTGGFATEADLAKIEEIAVVNCVGVPSSAHAATLTAEVICIKIGGYWYTSYIGTSIRPSA